MSNFNSDMSSYGANWLFSVSGIQRALGQVQVGALYLSDVGETKATGFFDPSWDGDGRMGDSDTPGAPRVTVTPSVDPSGRFYISASGAKQFTVTFTATPYGDNFASAPYKVADWLAVM